MTYAKLLVATDLSKEANGAVEAAIELAGMRTPPAELTLLHMVDLSELFPSFPVFLTPDRRKDIRDEVAAQVSASLEKLRSTRVPAAIPSHAVVEESTTVAQAICDYAREHDFDALVIGSHGRSGVKHALLGSVAERILRHAGLPVLVVPSRK